MKTDCAKNDLYSNAELIYGRHFDDEVTQIKDINGETTYAIAVCGRVFDLSFKDIKKLNKSLIIFGLTDYTDSISVKIFVDHRDDFYFSQKLREGVFLIIKGSIVFDSYDKELIMQRVSGIMAVPSFASERMDSSPRKRVELHCHTNMSAMDGVSSTKDIIEQAIKWGMPGIAITDHGVVQALTEAWHCITTYNNRHEDSVNDGFKLILGVEGYLVDIGRLENLDHIERDDMKDKRSYHVIILARNEIGRLNLYKLISMSQLNYFYRKPLIPRSELEKHREGLIIGSACCAGELYEALIERRSEDEIRKIVEFYDYLEIQPLSNNQFMIESDYFPYISTENDLKAVNFEIVRLGERYKKPVVATCDAHFLNPEDEIYRRILLAGMGMTEEPAPLYLRTTDEMLKEFSYLGDEKAKEVVIDNTNKIFDMCEYVPPVRTDKCPPVIEHSDEMLNAICRRKAHELYGRELPEIVEKRLTKELESVIGNGYSVLYIIASRLVKKSMQEGYLVGSRGSVGSSFGAYTAGITEVNPLPPHYLCPQCKHSDFTCKEVVCLDGNAGCDLPDKNCPICGTPMKKEGFGIPFETFLGFDGDKEPDIDLNFSGEIQGTIHKYTEEIFGKGYSFKAGTISTLAERSAYGFVMKYLEQNHITKRRTEIQRLVNGCVGVKRGTGQHPGGIIVLPNGEDINSFTPVQYPANDVNSQFITTHFDYHSIDHNLLKLDLLGHDDPTMLRFLHESTEFDPKNVPLDDPNVMMLFKGTGILGINPEQIGGVMLGCLGIPEFGTDFAMSMIIEAKPETFSDLIRISGLAHGTDVWLGNAQELIAGGTATLKSCICSRDDIMEYLIHMGIDKQMSFRIMESVRKGRGLSEEMEKTMKDAHVPEWYITSCKKIKYMFPKAHAAAYVMMAWRIAYYKEYYPLAFYAAWFSIRARALNYEKMFKGKGNLKKAISEYRSRIDMLSASEKEEYYALRVAEEMYERGIEIAPIDINTVDAKFFKVVGDRIIPSLVSIGGIGEKAAEQIIIAAKETSFISKEDFRSRTRCSQQVYDNMVRLGLLKNLPDSNQLSFFDYWDK